MSDEIDQLIEGVCGADYWRDMSEYERKDLRAVAEAAYRRGYESASLYHGKSDALARRALAKELLEKHRLDVAHAGFDVGKMLPDAQRIADSLLVYNLRKIAGGAGGDATGD